MPLSSLIEPTVELLTTFGLRILAAIAIIALGVWGARVVRRLVRRMMGQSRLDVTLVAFAANLTYVGIVGFATLSALSQLGLDTASVLTVLGAAGLAIGLALQGSLANFAAGILLVLFRPFKVGDFIEGAGTSGYAIEIQFLTTLVRTRQHKLVIIPNSKLVEGKIINHSAEPQVRVDITISVDGREGASRVRRVLLEEVRRCPLVLTIPAPTVGVLALGEGEIQFAVQPWVASPDHYWIVHFDLNEAIKERFDYEGIRLPEPPLTEMTEAIRNALHDGSPPEMDDAPSDDDSCAPQPELLTPPRPLQPPSRRDRDPAEQASQVTAATAASPEIERLSRGDRIGADRSESTEGADGDGDGGGD